MNFSLSFPASLLHIFECKFIIFEKDCDGNSTLKTLLNGKFRSIFVGLKKLKDVFSVSFYTENFTNDK